MAIPSNILVCGGAGFLGSHLVDAFLARDTVVTVVDPWVASPCGAEEFLASWGSRATWLRLPVEDVTVELWRDLLSRAHLLVDAMGWTRHWEGLADPERDHRLNYTNHLAVVRALETRPVPVIYLGSRGQYGRLSGVVTETSVMVPLDPQGVHKLAAESLYRIYAERWGFSCLSLRLGNCYGPRQPVEGPDIGLVGGFVRQLIRGEEVEVYGEPDRRRQLLYVDDLADRVVRLAAWSPKGFHALNMAGPNVLLRQLLELLTSLLGGRYRFRPFPPEVQELDCGSGELSEEALRRVLPDLAVTDLAGSLKATCHYFQKYLS